MLYHIYDVNHALMAPWRLGAGAAQAALQNPWAPWAYSRPARTLAASAELFERATRRYERPQFGLDKVTLDSGREAALAEEIVLDRPFCALTRFARDTRRRDPKLLLVAPLSGHYATLLRGTVAALLPHHDVHITDWHCASTVPLFHGRYGLADYIDDVMAFLHALGPGTHVVAVCQPAAPVLAAAALMAARGDPARPASLVLMGGPIDTRRPPTAVTRYAESHPLAWFERGALSRVPPWHLGAGRRVYPGFLQLSGFMSMNPDRHFNAHLRHFHHLVEGDGDSAAAHRRFYDEYLSVMDMPGEFYLDTVDQVFQRHLLPRGEMVWRGRAVDPAAITDIPLMTVEGERDDISAPGQTRAAHDLTPRLPAALKQAWLQPDTGHYGIFNGRKWREHIMPRLRAFFRAHEPGRVSPAPRALTAGPDAPRPVPLAADGRLTPESRIALPSEPAQ